MNLSFDDIALVPRVPSLIRSRDDIDITSCMGLGIPIISAPMKDVSNGEVSVFMNCLGGMGIIHRFMPIEQQVEEWRASCACAIGVNGDYLERFNALYEAGCRIFCIDTANGSNIRTFETIESLKEYEVGLIVGNVASKECFQWLDGQPNVIAIRVGIAGGCACTTKNATGIGYGMVSSIIECASVKKNALLIADGGIREPSDFCKALAVGADLVMLGRCIAATADSPAELVKQDGKLFKVYHGSASFDIQKEYRNNPKYIEGRTRLLEYDGETLTDLITRFTDGLRSCMSYFNAKNLEEFRKNVSWVTK